MSEKIYCGSGKKQKENWIKATINPDVINKYIQEYQGNKFVRLDINVNDKPNDYGKDVSISIDTWKPEKKESDTDDLPF